MIPLQVTLRNFLGYADIDGEPYSYDFREHRLWSISGDNGAGKSAIFDVVTYSLFGCHRGGKSRDEELVRKGASEMLCTFSFEHEGHEYRVTRTIKKRTRRSGQVAYDRAAQLDWYDEKAAAWREVPDTGSVTAIENYITGVLLGFGHETFVSSCLLVQGQSDKLISAEPRNRFGHLSGILDLRVYKRLEERAAGKAKALRVQHEMLRETLRELAVPTRDEVAAAKKESSDKESEAVAAEAELQTAEAWQRRVEAYHENCARRTTLQEQGAEMASALERREEIRAAADEQLMLTQVMPILKDACEALEAAEGAEARCQEAHQEASKLNVEACANDLRDAKTRHAKALREQVANATRMRETRSAQRAIEPKVKLASRLEELDASALELRKQAKELESTLKELPAARPKLERLESLNRGQLLMESYSSARQEEADHVKWLGSRSASAVLQEARSAREVAEASLKEARRAASEEQARVSRLQGQLDAATATLNQRLEAKAEGTCSRCGQLVSVEHSKREIAAARDHARELKRATAEGHKRVDVLCTQVTTCEDALDERAKSEEATAVKLEKLQEARASLAQLDSDGAMDGLPEDCRATLRGPVAQIDAGIKSFTRELGERATVARLVETLGASEADLRSNRTELAKVERSVGAVIEKVSRKDARATLVASRKLERDEVALEARAEELQSLLATTERNQQAAQEAHDNIVEQRNEFLTTSKVEAKSAEGSRSAAKSGLRRVDKKFLPPSRENIAVLERRLAELKDAEELLGQLERAERELDALRGRIQELDEKITSVPDGDQVSTESCKQEVEGARASASAARIAARDARERMLTLSRDRRERVKLQKEAESAEHAARTWDRLARLIGRGGLQLALMKRDLAEIEELANTMLARISGGQLELAIECTSRRNAEEIVFRCVDGGSTDEALDVAFLSGGQRFRVAVALAVGIGQYVGLGGAMPSQIIDEGFGSLDEDGRAEMLDAIREMSPHFERIILVSHTEAFHDAALFPARYELKREGRRTLVTASV